MPSFDHFVITRFSAVFTPDSPPADPEWLEYRYNFFREAACAALARQRGDVEFRWLVFIDDRADAEFIAAMVELSRGVFEPVLTHEVWGADLVQREVAARSSAPFLITTRLDSDDALGMRFIETVQSHFAEQELMYVNLNRGLQVDRTGSIYRFDAPANAFISLIEKRLPAQMPRTVYLDHYHTASRNHGPVLEVITRPMWIQVVHGGNIANQVRGTRVRPQVARAAIDMDLWYRTRIGPLRYAGEKLAWWREVVTTPGGIAGLLRDRAYRLQGTRMRPMLPQPAETSPRSLRAASDENRA
ncbi:glycosyltransferase [Leifsonia sp. TF02-11]|uniref:glycosyltransferase n=1 Tax=Leifsonia sp. TF02-11 TaxID=2815212 RepID=UPI001AA17779|nr:glycosyltransferase [Leifsonia sp. TF02-11]MBO1741655.1 hypothetical protein [Leifsonia sp. TF02-11]